MSTDDRVRELRLVLPEPFRSPTGATYPFVWVRTRGNRAYVSGHLPLQADGSLAEPCGKLGETISVEQGAQLARLAGLAMLASLQRELGELDRITAWLRVLAMVNVAPGASQLAGVANGFSELIIEVFGREVGAHARSAVGMAELPFGVAVEIEAELEFSPSSRGNIA